jgi:hypothetical protein
VVKYLRLFLVLVALHSVTVGINLITFPPEWMMKFGFTEVTNNFFKVQGGVFHLVMALAYLLAAWKPTEYRILIIFSISAKGIAALFLFSYYLVYQTTIMILISGIVDLLMGVCLFILYKYSDPGVNREFPVG